MYVSNFFSKNPLNPKSRQYPQLTAKAKVTNASANKGDKKKKGRCIVATQKILPGEVRHLTPHPIPVAH